MVGAGGVKAPARPGVLRHKRKALSAPLGLETEDHGAEGEWREHPGEEKEVEDEPYEEREKTRGGEDHAGGVAKSSKAALTQALGNLRKRLGIEKGTERKGGHGAGGERSVVIDAAPASSAKAKAQVKMRGQPEEKIEDDVMALRGTTMSSSKKGQTEKKERPGGGVLMELVNKAAKRPKELKEDKKESKSSKTAMALVQTLAKGLGVKKFQGKSIGGLKKKKKKKKKKDGDEPEDSSEGDHSGSSPTKSSETGSGDSSEENLERLEMAKATPPLERMSQKKKGSVLKLFVQHMRESLQNLDEGEAVEAQSVVGGVSAIKYWHLIIKPQMTGKMKEAREIYCLLQALDLLRGGHLDQMGDLLAARIMAIHQSVSDGGSWRAAKHLEIKPLETTSASKTSVVLQARKFAKIADRAQGLPPRRWSPYGKGGKTWFDEEDGTADGRGKGKRRKGKGKGKNKGGMKDWRENQEPPPGKAES